MATSDLSPLLYDHTEETDQADILKAWDRAVIASRILKTGILFVTAAAIVFAVLSAGNPLVLFANATASLVGASAPQDGTDQLVPTTSLSTLRNGRYSSSRFREGRYFCRYLGGCLFVSEQLQNGVPRRGVVRLRQDLTVMSKVLFVNVAIHSKPRSVRRERYRTLSHRKMPQVGQ